MAVVRDKDFPAAIDFTEYDGEDQDQDSSVVPEDWEQGVIVRPTLEQVVALSAASVIKPNELVRYMASASVAPNVKWTRAILPGMTGWDVRGHKRAWSRAFPDLYPWPTDGNGFTDFFGPIFKEAVIKGQKRMGILATGKIGSKTHEALERRHRKGTQEWAFDAQAIQLCADYYYEHSKTPEQRIREAIIAAWEFWCSLNSSEEYEQYRPVHYVKPPQYLRKQDCSVFYTAGCYAGGARDPNGFDFNGYGYTGTLQANTASCSIYDLVIADPVFYGFSAYKPGFNSGDPTHVAGYGGIQYSPERGRSVRVVYTMGSDRDPRKRPLDYRHDVNEYAKLRVA